MKLRGGPLLAALLLLLLSVGAACALELSSETIVPFGQNTILIRSDTAGSLTLTPSLPDFDLMPVVTDQPVSAGETLIPWDGLSWHGEPVPSGKLVLKATLCTASDAASETVESKAAGLKTVVSEASAEVKVSAPLCAAVSCLPVADVFCPKDEALRIECGLSRKGSVKVEISSAEAPDIVLCTLEGKAKDTVPVTLKWDGKDQKRKSLPDGDYLLTAYSAALPERRVSAAVTLSSAPVPVPAVFETGEILPANPDSDEEVWAALTAPAVVGAGTEGQGLYLMKKKKYSPGGSISARTAAVRVLEIDGAWCRVAAWRQAVGEYMEGWVQTEKLTVIPPRLHYGALISKKDHTMTVYEDGRPIGRIRVSTGLLSSANPLAATPPGVYLVGSRMQDFRMDGYHYDYPIRLHGDYLLHTVGYKTKDNLRYYTDELQDLGGEASHGCIRLDIRASGKNGGLNAWWVWTHLGRDTRIIITE